MTHPLVSMLDTITRKEAAVSDTRNDALEGYCDGMAGKEPQPGRSLDYSQGWVDGAMDDARLAKVAA